MIHNHSQRAQTHNAALASGFTLRPCAQNTGNCLSKIRFNENRAKLCDNKAITETSMVTTIGDYHWGATYEVHDSTN